VKTTYTRAATAATIAACAAVSAPSLAAAAVTIGGDVTASRAPVSCGGDATHPAACDIAQTALVGGRNAAPFDGVVVRWRVAGSGPVALRVVRPNAFTYTFVSTSAVQTPASTGVETFATRQPIRAGDDVGVELGPGSQIGAVDPAPADDTIAAWNPVSDGQSVAPLVYRTAYAVAYDADVEPDADHDGYGDETQDQCPSDASTQGACPPAPAAAGTSAAPPSVADRTPPALSTHTRSARLSKGGSISLVVTSSENATGLASGTVRARKAVRFAKRKLSLIAGRRAKVTLRLSRRGAALVRTAIANHARPTARVTLSVSDAAGNWSATKLALKLER
jgi:hypothetical protein